MVPNKDKMEPYTEGQLWKAHAGTNTREHFAWKSWMYSANLVTYLFECLIMM
jgi:hypothetical protein